MTREIRQQIYELMDCIKHASPYLEYQKAMEVLSEQPELLQRLNEYRKRSFALQESGRDIFDGGEMLNSEYKDLISNPEVGEYLNAEVALCRMVQEISEELGNLLNAPE